MSETISIRIDSKTKMRLDALSNRSNRSKSFLAAEAITAFVDAREWQLGEIHKAIEDLDSGKSASHDKVSNWLKTSGKAGESKAPRRSFQRVRPGERTRSSSR
jgi:RHH-type transcriptional regulator, rel operon repressor / antitoxin RelB